MTSDGETADRDQLLSDVTDHLTRQYDIDEEQIETDRKLGDAVTLRIKDSAGDFPGFKDNSVDVIGMSDEIRYGYVPRGHRWKSVRIRTEQKLPPESR